MKKMNTRTLFLGNVILLLVILGGSVLYVSDYYRADEVAIAALSQPKSVIVSTYDNFTVFAPLGKESTIGFAFYPGGKVEYSAYSQLMTSLAENGITCALLKMPLNLAVLDINGADRAIQTLASIDTWYVGGHSLGGSMASIYAQGHADLLKGIILLGSYPATDLSKTRLAMLSIVGSQDGVVNTTKIEEAKALAPANTIYHVINGGNHAYYGNYGEQKGDGIATITTEEQQLQTVLQILSFIQ